jgi:hypothetical protein
MPAGFATKRGYVQVSPEKSKHGVHMFGRNAFQGKIAANRAVGVK